MRTLFYALSAAALAAALGTSANAGNGDGFIRPDTRIRGCIAIVDKVRDGTITPTEWLEQNKEEFADLQLELKSRNYPPQKAKDMMMGMAITICMERKNYINTCVSARDEEKRDLQIMRTAHIAECWAKERVGEATPPPPPPPPPPPEPPVVVAPPPLPPMSQEDVAQFNEDMAIISQPVRIIGDDEAGAKEARLQSCAVYWADRLHYNRNIDARHLLWGVRVSRCMFRTHYAIFPQRCPEATNLRANWRLAVEALTHSHCYARF